MGSLLWTGVHDRLCASLGGLKRVGAVAADGGATRSLLVE